MNPLKYVKAVLGVVGALTIPPIATWAVSGIPAPDNVHSAMSMLLTALILGPAIYAAPNATPKP